MPKKVFISYRRKTWGFTFTVADELRARLDADIFVDVDGVDQADFERSIMGHLRSSHIVALIVSEYTFTDRIHNDDDWVRREIAESLRLGIPIVLVSVDGQMPPAVLPDNIKDIARSQAINFYPEYFAPACDRLANFLAKAADIPLRSSTATITEAPKPPASPRIEVVPPSSPRSYQLGDTRTDPHGVPQIYVPAGRFLMGSDPNHDASTQVDEKPAHEVRITAGFWLDQFPVTNAAFKAFTDAGGYREDRWWSPDGLKWRQKDKVTAPKDFPNFIENPMQPRVGINWYEAEAYANWRGGRLPTEAEWEYAARGEQSLLYPWGNAYDPNRLNSEKRFTYTTPVDAHPDGKSWCDAYDMSGNVGEWCADWYASNFYTQCVKNNLINDPCNTTAAKHRVLRGGAFFSDPDYCRTTVRAYNLTERENGRGCRIVSAAG